MILSEANFLAFGTVLVLAYGRVSFEKKSLRDSRLGDSLRCIDPINAVFVDTIWAVLK